MQPTIAVDIAKNVFEIAISRHPGKVAERHRLSRTKFLRFFAQREPSRLLLEVMRYELFVSSFARQVIIEIRAGAHEVVKTVLKNGPPSQGSNSG